MRTSKGCLVGVCGDIDAAVLFLKWAESGFKETKQFSVLSSGDVGGLRVNPDGVVECYEGSVGFFQMEAPFYALGSGSVIAIGAMAAGADAETAAKIACKYSHGCGEPVHVLRMEN